MMSLLNSVSPAELAIFVAVLWLFSRFLVAFQFKRMVASIDNLTDAVAEVKAELHKNYRTKDECDEIRRECREVWLASKRQGG